MNITITPGAATDDATQIDNIVSNMESNLETLEAEKEQLEYKVALLEDEEYKARYHEYYNQLVEEYVYGGRFEETYNRIRTQIDELVKNDPNAMFTYEEYLESAEYIRSRIGGFMPEVLMILGSGLGFMLAMVLFSGVRSRIEGCDAPESYQGLPITLVAASITSVSFMGFAGVVENLFR